MYFDSHCHLDMEPLTAAVEGAIKRAEESGVTTMINVGSSLSGSESTVELANTYPGIWASVGLHPHDSEKASNMESVLSKLRELAKNKKVVAIGEIGLDYYSPEGPLTKAQIESQKELFAAQLELAQKLKLPVIIHVRDAWEDFFPIIKNYKLKITNSNEVGVVHCFTGDALIAQKCLDLGLFIGFTGIITFKNKTVDEIREAVKVVPLEKILIETDAPLLAPNPYRGKPNEPAYVVEVAKKIAEIKSVSVAEVARITTDNAKKLFGIK